MAKLATFTILFAAKLAVKLDYSNMLSQILIYSKPIYRIALNYSRSRINAWSRLVTGGNSIITKIKARSQINAGSFVGPQ